jgi:hypothetical protein
MENELSFEEVHRRISEYAPAKVEVTNELYKLGEMLLREGEERSGSLDSKGTAILGYSGVILAFLLANAPQWSQQMNAIEKFLISLAGLFTLAATVQAFRSVRATSWRWFTDAAWFEEKAFNSAENLRRYYITQMHDINQTNSRINEQKGSALVGAQRFLAISVAILAGALVVHLLPVWLVFTGS